MEQFMPSRFANRFYLANCKEILRLSFGERLNDQEAWHTAIVMLPQDAIALRDSLNKLFPVDAPASQLAVQ